MRRISVSKSPTTAPSKCTMSSTKPHPPKADTWPLVSSSAYQRVPFPKSPDWVGPYASGRTHSWPTSTQAEPAAHRTEAIDGIIELGRRIVRGYRNPTNYQLRMLLIAGGLDASPTLNSEEPHKQNVNNLRTGPGLGAGVALASSVFGQMVGPRHLGVLAHDCATGLRV